MGWYDILDDITQKQLTKTELGDNRMPGVTVGIVAKKYNRDMPDGYASRFRSGMKRRIFFSGRELPCLLQEKNGELILYRKSGIRYCWHLKRAISINLMS